MLSNTEIENNHSRICSLLQKKQLKDAFGRINYIIKNYPDSDHASLLQKNISTYENILRYTFQGVDDPHKDKIYLKLVRSTLYLADIVKQHALSQNPEMSLLRQKLKYQNNAHFTKKEAQKLIHEFTLNIELNELLKQSDIGSVQNGESPNDDHHKKLDDIFNRIWLTDKYYEADIELVKNIIQADSFPWYEKSLIVTALTISILTCFDLDKIDLLIEFILTKEPQIWQRALVGLIIISFYHNERLKYYPELETKLKLVRDAVDTQIIEITILQLIKSRDTESFTEKFEEEIVPELIKNAPRLTEKLDLDNLFNEDLEDRENPDWEKIFEDSEDLYRKIEDYSKLQMEGADIFMSAFSKLKHFPFFNNLHNWFIPFYAENLQIQDALTDEKSKELLKALETLPFLCNSDKYSFLLNIKNMPAAQRETMLDLFIQEMSSMKELNEEEKIINKDEFEATVITQYIQDLYRFYKLFPQKKQFQDIFTKEINIIDLCFKDSIIDNIETYKRIAGYYFKEAHYTEAIEIYRFLELKSEVDYAIFQQTAFSYQKQGNYSEALKYYLKAELFDNNHEWNIKKIAYCYKKLHDYENALKYYLEAEKLDPDNLYIQANIGQSYLNLGAYELALKYYFKVEYLAPSNTKILRPIAWCYFMTGNFVEAATYYDKIPQKELGLHDIINRGHLEYCNNNKQAAIDYYLKAMELPETQLKNFISIILADREYLEKHGIDMEEIPLLLDHLRYQKDA